MLTLLLTRLPYEFFCLPYISHFVSFDNLGVNLNQTISFHVVDICPCSHLRGPASKKQPMISGSKIELADFYLPSRGYQIPFN